MRLEKVADQILGNNCGNVVLILLRYNPKTKEHLIAAINKVPKTSKDKGEVRAGGTDPGNKLIMMFSCRSMAACWTKACWTKMVGRENCCLKREMPSKRRSWKKCPGQSTTKFKQHGIERICERVTDKMKFWE